MKISRRSFVILGGATAVATLGLPVGVMGQKTEVDTLSLLSADRFRTYIGTEFQISGEGTTFSATLLDVKDYATKTGECFSLDFKANIRNPGQQRYQLSHFALGDFDLLMVGHQSSRKTSLLVATINRL